MNTAEKIEAVRDIYSNPPKEITRSITLSGADAARYAFAEAILQTSLGLSRDAAAAFLLAAGSAGEVRRFSEAMAEVAHTAELHGGLPTDGI